MFSFQDEAALTPQKAQKHAPLADSWHRLPGPTEREDNEILQLTITAVCALGDSEHLIDTIIKVYIQIHLEGV